MKQALRPLSASARSALAGPRLSTHTRGLVCPARPASRVAGCCVAPRARRRDYEAFVRRTPAGSRGYLVKVGNEGLSEEAKKRLDDQNKANLGKSEFPTPSDTTEPLLVRRPQLTLTPAISILKERLPTILQQPLPSEILSPNISLHLFPTTHPHLPVANGKAAYKAALWTSPIAWNRLPVIGNVGIEVQRIRLQPGPLPFAPARVGSLDEMMVVRWVTEPSTLPSEFLRNLAARVSGGEGNGEDKLPKEFMGLFAFQFDEQGRILDHTIESAEHGRNWGKGVGSSVLSFTDRVLGGIRQRGVPDPLPMPACWRKGGRKG